MASTASTMDGVSCSARELLSLVDKDVRATESRSSRSTSFWSLNSSRNYGQERLERSKVSIRGSNTLRVSDLANS